MIIEVIKQKIKDINIYSLNSLKNTYDDENINKAEYQIKSLLIKKDSLTDLLKNYFNNLIGL